MIDQDQQRDHAEEAAVRSEQNAERASEQAHADLVSETVRRLRTLSHGALADAQETVASLSGEVNLRQAPNAHRYELLARQQHTALLAAMVAAAIEETSEYDLARVANGVVESYTATHLTDRTRIVADLTDRALLAASGRVEDAVAEVASFAQQAQTDREVEQHERDLADRDRESYAGHPADVAVAEADSTL